jgi:cyclopropane-fatty-acyl-phospholipid synthase
MLLQAIVIDDRAYELEKASRSFVKEFIFPAGCLPSVEVISRCVARSTDMRVLDLEDITDNYPPTLRHWRENFVAAADRAEELGYDRRFRRIWELYLAWCEGGFMERRIGDVQALLAKPAFRRPAPWRGETPALAGA